MGVPRAGGLGTRAADSLKMEKAMGLALTGRFPEWDGVNRAEAAVVINASIIGTE